MGPVGLSRPPRSRSCWTATIFLASRSLLPERPTLAESLRASGDALGVTVSADEAVLAPADAAEIAALLGQAQPVVFGVQGPLVGSRSLHQVQLALTFGAWGLRVTYVPPGAIAPYGLLFNPGSAGNWGYVQLLTPPGYVAWAYTAPAQLDGLMAELGFTGKPEGDIVQDRVVPLAQARLTSGVDRYEAWAGDGARVTVTLPPDQAVFVECPGAASCAPVGPFSGPSMNVEIWPIGLDPFPEAVRPARYVYYARDASGSSPGVLVMTRQEAYANVGGIIVPPAYASPALDAELKAQLVRLTALSAHPSSARVARSLGVGIPAVSLGVLAIAYVSWDAERKRRRSEGK